MIAGRLMECCSVVCASPGYLRTHPAPRHIDYLGKHICLTLFNFDKKLWHFEVQGQVVTAVVGGNVIANEATSIKHAALDGEGIAVLPSVKPHDLSIHAIYTAGKRFPRIISSHEHL